MGLDQTVKGVRFIREAHRQHLASKGGKIFHGKTISPFEQPYSPKFR